MGWSQSELADRSEVSRQTISRALKRDEVSERTTERIAAALGQLSDRPVPATAPEPRSGTGRPPITGPGLCDATDLVSWAQCREAQALLPKVIRRLVLATASAVKRRTSALTTACSFPDGTGSGTPTRPVPSRPRARRAGRWAWELGPETRPRRTWRTELSS